MPVPITTVSGLLLDGQGQPRRGAVVLFEPLLETVPAEDRSALIIYETVRRVTGDDGVMPPADLVASDATGVTVPWRVQVRARGESESWEFIAVEGPMNLPDIPQLPALSEQVAGWVAFEGRVKADADRAEAAREGLEEMEAGADGASAYEVAVANGFVGTEPEWLASLVGEPGTPAEPAEPGEPGASAYDLAVLAGFVGSVDDWLDSLAGQPGGPGDDGAPGASAYQLALAAGFVGSQSAWLASLKGEPGEDGDDGATAYQLAVAAGFVGSQAAWLESLHGAPGGPGPSAYDVAVSNGFVGSQAAWLASLEGSDGADGVDAPKDWTHVKAGWQIAPTGVLSIGAATHVRNKLCVSPIDVRKAVTPDAFVYQVNTAQSGGAASVVTLVLYGSDADGWPNPAGGVLATASADVATTGIKVTTASFSQLAPGRYWIGGLWTYTTVPTVAPKLMASTNSILDLPTTTALAPGGTHRGFGVLNLTTLPTTSQSWDVLTTTDGYAVGLRA